MIFSDYIKQSEVFQTKDLTKSFSHSSDDNYSQDSGTKSQDWIIA